MLRKGRKQGAIIIEFLVVLPVFMLLIWGILQSMLFIMAHSTVHEAAMETARISAMEIRGSTNGMPASGSPKAEELEAKVINKVMAITEFNRFIMLFTDGSGASYDDPPDVVIKPGIIQSQADNCDSELTGNSKGRIICVYDAKYTSSANAREAQQVVVKIKAKFFVVGSFIPGLSTIPIKAVGASQVETTDFFQYYEVSSPRVYGE